MDSVDRRSQRTPLPLVLRWPFWVAGGSRHKPGEILAFSPWLPIAGWPERARTAGAESDRAYKRSCFCDMLSLAARLVELSDLRPEFVAFV